MSQTGIACGEDTLVTRWARAWSTQDTSLFLSLFAGDALYCDVALEKVFRGREAIKAFFEGTFVTFPDFKMEIERCAVSAQAAAGEWVMSGTFLGESFGVPPTGKAFRVQGCCFMRLVDGQIVEHRDYWNPATFRPAGQDLATRIPVPIDCRQARRMGAPVAAVSLCSNLDKMSILT